MTLAQVLLAFDGMTEYVLLTSPFGSGDADGNASPGAPAREFIDQDQPGASMVLGGGALGPVQRISIDDVPDDIRDLLR
jgi:hypothetical protein